MISGEAIWIIVLVLAIGLAGAMIAMFVSRRSNEPDVSNETTETEKKNSGETMGASLAIGIGAGVAIGVALGNVAMGIAIGVAIGIAIGAGKSASC